MSAEASPQTPLGELTALSKPLAGFKWAASRQEGNKRDGRKGLGGRGERGREGKGGGRGIAPWLLGE